MGPNIHGRASPTPLYLPSAAGPHPRMPHASAHRHAPVAQPDRVVASEAIGRGFESLRARHSWGFSARCGELVLTGR
jgi:hypothetical protein